MMTLFAAGLVLISGALFAPADAQQAPVYRYCLVEGSGGFRGGGGTMWCRYNTLAQCMASRTGNSDTCIVNPQLTMRR